VADPSAHLNEEVFNYKGYFGSSGKLAQGSLPRRGFFWISHSRLHHGGGINVWENFPAVVWQTAVRGVSLLLFYMSFPTAVLYSI